MPIARPLGLACYGANGHQVHRHPLIAQGRVRLVAIAGIDPQQAPGARVAGGLDALLADPQVEAVSLCSPRRADQARDAIRCLEAGRHVYAEKPCALSEADLDAVVAAAARAGRSFREMAGSAGSPHYATLRRLVADGAIGTPYQVLMQKSYPWHADRPQDEDIDGGLLLQVGVHAARIAEALAGSPLATVTADDTGLGNPGKGGLRMGAGLLMRHVNGCVSVAAANYGNTTTLGVWGNDTARVFGPKGFLDCEEDGRRMRLVTREAPPAAIACTEPGAEHFALFLDELAGAAGVLPPVADELRPVRLLVRARSRLRGG